MEITTYGVFRDGFVVLDPGAPQLQDGAKVRIIGPAATAEEMPPQTDPEGYDFLLRVAAMAKPTGISDLAENLDHYLYGHPKVDDESE